MTADFSHCLLTIDADYHAQAPAQVIGCITRHNRLPSWFSVRPTGTDSLRIVMELDGFDMDAVDRIVKRINSLPSIVGVSRALMMKRTPIVP